MLQAINKMNKHKTDQNFQLAKHWTHKWKNLTVEIENQVTKSYKIAAALKHEIVNHKYISGRLGW